MKKYAIILCSLVVLCLNAQALSPEERQRIVERKM